MNNRTCPRCGGHGSVWGQDPCPTCGGAGTVAPEPKNPAESEAMGSAEPGVTPGPTIPPQPAPEPNPNDSRIYMVDPAPDSLDELTRLLNDLYFTGFLEAHSSDDRHVAEAHAAITKLIDAAYDKGRGDGQRDVYGKR